MWNLLWMCTVSWYIQTYMHACMHRDWMMIKSIYVGIFPKTILTIYIFLVAEINCKFDIWFEKSPISVYSYATEWKWTFWMIIKGQYLPMQCKFRKIILIKIYFMLECFILQLIILRQLQIGISNGPYNCATWKWFSLRLAIDALQIFFCSFLTD